MKEFKNLFKLSLVWCMLVSVSHLFAQELTFSSASNQTVCGDVTSPNINQSGGCILPPVGAGAAGDVPCSAVGTPTAGQSTQFRMVIPTLTGGTGPSNYRLTAVQLNFTIASWGGDFQLNLRRPSGAYLNLMNPVGNSASSNTINVTLCDTASRVYPASAGAISGFYQIKAAAVGSATHLGSGQSCNATPPTNSACCMHDFNPAGTNIGGDWSLVFTNGWSGETGQMNSWGMTFALPDTLPTYRTVTVAPLSPGTCSPAPVACSVPAPVFSPATVPGSLAPVASNTVSPFNGGTAGTNVTAAAGGVQVSYIVQTSATPTITCLTAPQFVNCPAAGITFTSPGVKYILWRSSRGCGAFDTSLQIVNIADTEPPTFMPACPTKPITLNAGPGECEVSWDAPVFMAMDNCPAGQYFGAINRVTNICRTNAAWQISGGAGAWGVMFDLVNTSGGQLNLQEVGWLSFANVTHNIYYKTTPGGHASVQATPSAWTLCASRVARRAGFNGPKDTFDLVTATVYDTLKKCSPILVDSTKLGCLTMAAGETRGVYIHAPGQASAYLSIFGDCTTGVFGDANVNTPVNGATYTGGLFTAPFVNSSFGFGN
ncbi:MAG TPA: hypothetical protein PK006_10930, partial [Saprospiraceae bacterium]|nr:hypothetical protein [Saprospiraceae bacterium]